MISLLRLTAQALLYVPLMFLIGYFSTQPRFAVMPEDHALLRLTLIHAGQRVGECRERTPEELARLAPNMRTPLECPRERAPVVVELLLDGELLYRVQAPPTGLRRDGASAVYRRSVIPAGRHRVAVRLSDRPDGAFGYSKEAELELAAGASLLIDFDSAKGEFVFRG